MSSERVNSADMRIKRLNQEATNLKTSQTTGWDSVRSYCIQTTNTFDYSYTPTFVGGQTAETMHLYVKYTADHQQAPWAMATAKILVNDTEYFRVGNFAADVPNTRDYGIYTNGWVRDSYGNYSPTGKPNNINEVSFYNAISFTGQINVKIKFYVWATDTGRLTVGVDNNDFEGIIIQ